MPRRMDSNHPLYNVPTSVPVFPVNIQDHRGVGQAVLATKYGRITHVDKGAYWGTVENEIYIGDIFKPVEIPDESEQIIMRLLAYYISRELGSGDFHVRICPNANCSHPVNIVGYKRRHDYCDRCGTPLSITRVLSGEIDEWTDRPIGLPETIKLGDPAIANRISTLARLADQGKINFRYESYSIVTLALAFYWENPAIFADGNTCFRGKGHRELLASRYGADAAQTTVVGSSTYVNYREPGFNDGWLRFIEEHGQAFVENPLADLNPEASDMARDAWCERMIVENGHAQAHILEALGIVRVPGELSEIICESLYSIYSRVMAIAGERPVIAANGSIDYRTDQIKPYAERDFIIDLLVEWGASRRDAEKAVA